MPFDVMFSYVALDSIMRYSNMFIAKSLVNSWTTLNDTLKSAIKYYYKINDYNPVSYVQYSHSIRDYKRFPKNLVNQRLVNINTGEVISDTIPAQDTILYSGKYRNDIMDLEELLVNKYMSFIPKEDFRKFKALLEADYILRVRILDIDSTVAKNSTVSKFIYNVNAEVLDTLKGKYFKNSCNNPEPTTSDNNIITNILPCMNFMYDKELYDPEYKQINWINDPAFEQSYNGFGFLPNQEVIVFLKFYGRKIDNQNDYFDLLVHKFSSNGAIPIINGQVRDLNHFWSDSDLINYTEWLEIFNQVKNEINN